MSPESKIAINITPPVGEALKREEKARKPISKHLKNASLLRQQVFADFTLAQYLKSLLAERGLTASEKKGRQEEFDNVIEATNQRSIIFKRYEKETSKIEKKTYSFYLNCIRSSYTSYEAYSKFARRLIKINQELGNKTPESPTIREKLYTVCRGYPETKLGKKVNLLDS